VVVRHGLLCGLVGGEVRLILGAFEAGVKVQLRMTWW
jgi:hypothetical protein